MNHLERKNFLKDKLIREGCSREELQELYYLIQTYGQQAEFDELMREVWALADNSSQTDDEVSRAMYAYIRKRLPITDKNNKADYRNFIGIAATVLLLIGVGLLTHLIVSKKDVQSIQYVTKATKKGQRASFTLSDGTQVMLNAESSITFPATFTDSVRKVSLRGEAFFEVAKNPQQPFVVASEGLTTRVLGTSFNINTFPDTKVEVTVVTGSVRVSSQENARPGNDTSSQTTLLKPMQQASFDKHARAITVSEVDPELYLAWKNNTLYFEMVPFKEVVSTLERWYNIKISLQNHTADHCLIRAGYADENLANVLEGLKLLLNFEYTFEHDEHVIITPEGCKK